MTLHKSKTGISGLDDITGGGLPQGRPSLVCGGAGSGKTLFGIEFLFNGARDYDEPGVLVSFEETADELITNASSIGCTLDDLIDSRKLIVDEVRVERADVEETGSYDLDGLFIRLGYAIDSIGAKRVVLDTIEVLFAVLSDEFTLRSELQRLFRWLKEKGVTVVITGERGQTTLTRHGMEEYVSDCVIVLDHRANEQIATRRLRVVKYRGSAHGTNEYPFLIDDTGIAILPITSLGLNHIALDERVSSGIPQLDQMMDNQGFFRGSSIMVSGTAGSGKTSLVSQFTEAACARGERCLYFAFEESESQIIRDMRSIGLNLAQWVESGVLRFSPTRPTSYGLEMHLVMMHKLIRDFQPTNVIVDPVTSFTGIGTPFDIKATLMRLIDDLKVNHISCLITSLTKDTDHLEQSEAYISSIIDTWIMLRHIETNGERNRLMNIMKSRGAMHSNQVKEFLLTPHGIELVDTYIGKGQVLTGSSRLIQQLQEDMTEQSRQKDFENQKRMFATRRQVLESRIAVLQAELDAQTEEANQFEAQEQRRTDLVQIERRMLLDSRQVNSGSADRARVTTARVSPASDTANRRASAGEE